MSNASKVSLGGLGAVVEGVSIGKAGEGSLAPGRIVTCNNENELERNQEINV